MKYDKKKITVVLLSGGMDSAVVAAIVRSQCWELAAMHLNYGQRTETREMRCFEALCDHFGIERRLSTNVGYLTQIGGSSLTDKEIAVPAPDLDSPQIPNSYVPFRNGNILCIAASWAEVIGAEAIAIGAMEQDSSGYPDCRKEFFAAMERAIDLGTKPETNIKILTPIIDMEKSDIVKIGLELGVPFDKTWSCYKSDETACGECESCALRLRGFERAGAKDPIKYA